MRGRLPKIRRTAGASDAPDAATAGSVPPTSPDDQPTQAYATGVVPPPVPQPPAPPADLDPASLQVAGTPSFRDRGRLRRRLGYLRRVRELGFRDLGGLVFDLHRFGREGQPLVQAKLDALTVVDQELRALERVLKDKPLYVDLREPGIAACPRCAALHGSDARFCPSCGIRLSGPLGIGEIVEGGHPVAPPPAQVAATPAETAAAPTQVLAPSEAPTTAMPAVAEPEPAPEPEPEPDVAAAEAQAGEAQPEPAAQEPEPAAQEPAGDPADAGGDEDPPADTPPS